MKIYIPNSSKQSLGGGWTWIRNFKKGCGSAVEFVDKWQDCDIYLIMSVTTTDKNELKEAKEAGKKIVLRVDNIPKKSRNKRQDPPARITEFGEMANLVIFQSEWAKEYAGWLIKYQYNRKVIYNGVDLSTFHKPEHPPVGNKFLFVHYNRDDCKRYHEAFYTYHMWFREHRDSELTIVGRFSPDVVENNFDFFGREKVNYLGVIDDPKRMATVMRAHHALLFPSFGDACPQTVIEALGCGLSIIGVNEVGGTKELLDLPYEDLSCNRMANEYINEFQKL